MPDRRGFIAGMAAAGLSPQLSWADAGDPAWLSAARRSDGSYRLYGLAPDATPVFSLPLPGRGRAAACHPLQPEAVAFARRPGTFAIVLNCATGEVRATLDAPPERHFYGHGVYSGDGTRLFTTENAFELGEGRIGVWAADDGYRRIGEFWSGGIGPHDLRRLPGTDILVVANGGIDTHPDSGRTKLNLPTMRSNLTYLDGSGEITDQVELRPDWRLNSIRHLAVRRDGLVAFACQWQADFVPNLSLQGTHRRGESPRMLELKGDTRPTYAGSIAFNDGGTKIGVTYPRSNGFLTWTLGSRQTGTWTDMQDACGMAPDSEGFIVSTGTGRIVRTSGGPPDAINAFAGLAWDNHLVTLR